MSQPLYSRVIKVTINLDLNYTSVGLLKTRNLLDVSECTLIFQGQVTVHAKFDKDIYLPEDAEFYFVYDGSLKRYTMFAGRVSDALQSIVPVLSSCSYFSTLCSTPTPFHCWA